MNKEFLSYCSYSKLGFLLCIKFCTLFSGHTVYCLNQIGFRRGEKSSLTFLYLARCHIISFLSRMETKIWNYSFKVKKQVYKKPETSLFGFLSYPSIDFDNFVVPVFSKFIFLFISWSNSTFFSTLLFFHQLFRYFV